MQAVHLGALLEAKSLCKYYLTKKGVLQSFRGLKPEWFKAVDDVNISLDRGKILVVAGQSGSGKTTMAKLIMGAITPTSGIISFDGRDITRLSRSDLREFRSRVHMVYQDPYSSLDPRMKILDIVREPLDVHDRRSSRQERDEKSLKALEEVRLKPEIAKEMPQKLSGGQRQRVALARAIVLRPQLIVADEPVSMLDVSVRAEILTLMLGLRDKFEAAFIYITHDLSTASYVGDSIAIMKQGRIVEQGPIDDVLQRPSHPYTKDLISAIPDIDSNASIAATAGSNKDVIIVTGHGFNFEIQVAITIDGIGSSATIKTDSSGDFTCSLQIPVTSSGTVLDIKATEFDSGIFASAAFRVP